jgi:hypothetical protein
MSYTPKFDYFRSGPLYEALHVVHAYLFESGELKVLIERRGTSQKPFYTIRRFRQGIRSKAIGRFTFEDAVAAAENPQMI